MPEIETPQTHGSGGESSHEDVDNKPTQSIDNGFQEFEHGPDELVTPRSRLKLFAILVALNVCSAPPPYRTGTRGV